MAVSPNLLQAFAIVNTMQPAERGMLRAIITYGKDLPQEAGRLVESDFQLATFGNKVSGATVARYLYAAFKEGVGFADRLKGYPRSYGKQLDLIIKKTILKPLKLKKPNFKEKANTLAGAYERERFVTESLMDNLIKTMDNATQKEFAKNIDDFLKHKGVDTDLAGQVSAALIQGGLVAARTIMGASFGLLLVRVAGLINAMLFGKTLTVAAAAGLSRFAGIFFGPIGLGITAILTIPIITTLFNKRNYDKYLPAIFLIGLARLAKEGEFE